MVVSKNKKAKESLRKYLQRENAALEKATKSIKNKKSTKMIPFFACNMHVKHAFKNKHIYIHLNMFLRHTIDISVRSNKIH
jgi:hypothetical protein